MSTIVSTRDITDSEILLCINYEIDLLLDGITQDNIFVFNKLLMAIQKITVQHAVMISHAWQQYFSPLSVDGSSDEMPRIAFSPLLSTALTGIVSDPISFHGGFISFVSQIATKMLLFQFDTATRPLAAFICTIFSRHCFDDDGGDENNGRGEWNSERKSLNALHKYAMAIVEDADDKAATAYRVTSTCFGDNNFHSQLSSAIVKHGDGSNYDDGGHKMKQLYEIAAVSWMSLIFS